MFKAVSNTNLYFSVWSGDIYLFVNWFACFSLQDVRLILKVFFFIKKRIYQMLDIVGS